MTHRIRASLIEFLGTMRLAIPARRIRSRVRPVSAPVAGQIGATF